MAFLVLLLYLFASGLVASTGDGLVPAMVAWSSTTAVCAVSATATLEKKSAHARAPYGAEEDEVIRFMDSASVSAALLETLPEEADSWLIQVEEEARLVEALPFVKGVVSFITSEVSANLNKVQATVWCSWSSGQLKRVLVSCDEAEKPTHLETLRALRKKLIGEHGASDQSAHHKAAELRARLEASGDADAADAPAGDRGHLNRARAVLCKNTIVLGWVFSCGSERAPRDSTHTRRPGQKRWSGRRKRSMRGSNCRRAQTIGMSRIPQSQPLLPFPHSSLRSPLVVRRLSLLTAGE